MNKDRYEVTNLNYTDRKRILTIIVKDRELEIEDPVIEYIAGNMNKNIRELEGYINRLIACSSMNNRKIDLDFAKECLGAEFGVSSDASYIFEKSVEYYEEQLKNCDSEDVLRFVNKYQLNSVHIKPFRLGYADQRRDSFYQFMKTEGFEDSSLLESGLVRYSEENGFSDVFCKRIIFPIISDENVVQGLGSVSIGTDGVKFLNVFNRSIPSDEKVMIFGLNVLKENNQNNLILCEGYLDAMAMHNEGLSQTIVMLGGEITDEQVTVISEHTRNVFIAFDTDEYGKKKSDKAREIFEKFGINVWVINLKPYKDPYEYIYRSNRSNDYFE